MSQNKKDVPPLRQDINIDKPRYDQNTYLGRAQYYYDTLHPLNFFASNTALENAKTIVEKYKKKEKLYITEEELWTAKNLYDSAFHPTTGEKMIAIGRMCSQAPINTVVVGGMLTFYKNPLSVFFWQWLNQSYNALVNYTNKSGAMEISDQEVIKCYAAATTGAVSTALGLNYLVKSLPPLLGRCVPFVAVAVANAINIPLMRLRELQDGIDVEDENGKVVGKSKKAAVEGISQVVASRIIMSSPGLILTPLLMDQLEKRGVLCRYPRISLPVQALLTGLIFTFATPFSCAIFVQKSSISSDRVEPELKEKLGKAPPVLYYNKGL